MAKTDKSESTALPVMVHPASGQEWQPEDRAEVTNLKARGWRVKSAAPANKSATATTK